MSAASATTTVTIQDVSIEEGETTTVPIMINDVVDASIAHIVLSYNQSVVNVTDIGNSDFSMETWKEMNNSGGYVRYTVFDAGVTGNIKFADVTLEAVGSHGEQSPLNLNLTVVSLLNTTGGEIPGDVLDGTFTITGVPEEPTTSVPSPSPTPDTSNNGVHNGISGDVNEGGTLTTSTPTLSPSPTSKPLMPGFDAIFAIVSLFSVTYLIFRKRTT